MNAEERAREVKAATSSDWSKRTGGHKLDKVKGEQKLTVTREPEFLYDKDGNVVGVDAWVQLFDANGRELKIDPHRRIINPPTVPRSGVVEEETGEVDRSGQPLKRRILTPDPTTAFYEAVWDSVIGIPNEKGWRTRGTVTTVFADQSDGFIESTNATYAIARTGGTLSIPNESIFDLIVGQDGGFDCYECFLSFDTSSIPDSDVVSSVVLDTFLTEDRSLGPDFIVEARESNWGASLTTADWISGAILGSLPLMASISTSGIGSIDSYKTFTSEPSFTSATNLKTGFVYLMLSSSRHRLGDPPVGDTDEYIAISPASVSGTTEDPKLTITHAAPKAMVSSSRPNRIWRLY